MRRLLAATCLTPACLLIAGAARADTTISTTTSANLATSTASSGAPDNIVIASGGTVSPASGTAVTIDSNNTVSNAGTITMTDISNATGIAARGGLTTAITNSGTITVTETYAQTDTNSDGVVDGPFAQGTNRYGVRVTGSDPLAGTITNSGTITVKGIGSGGIVSDAPITGAVLNSGAISVTGDGGYGIRLAGVGDKVTVTGAVGTIGAGSVGIALTGDVAGQVTIHSTVSSTGYTSTTLPASLTSLTADNLLQGGSALLVQGNVGGGILVGVTPTDTSDTAADKDGDGVADASEASGAVISYGSAPAVAIGAADRAITLGTVASSTGGLVISGSVAGIGVYPGVDATAVRIAGLGQNVTVTGGMVVSGTVGTSSNAARAVAIDLAPGAIVPSLTNSGSITAASTTAAGGSAYGVLIEAGASLPSIANSGTISATPPTTADTAAAILDQSGTLTQVTNTGTIKATGGNGSPVAIDVSGNTSGFTYTQAATSTSTTPSLVGGITTGSGNDTIVLSAGTAAGAMKLGAGTDTIALSGAASLSGALNLGSGDDRVTLADTSSYTGAADFGTGSNTLAIGGTASFSGSLAATGGQLAVSVAGGTLSFTGTGTQSLASLSVAGGTLGVTIDPKTGAYTQIAVSGATSFTGATTVVAKLVSLPSTNASYTVLASGTLSGTSALTLSTPNLPYLITGTLSTNEAAGTVAVGFARRTAAAIGFSRSEASAYDAVYSQIAANSTLQTLFLNLGDRSSFVARYRQMLPDHAGGVFDVLQTGWRTMAPNMGQVPLKEFGSVSLWTQQAYWSDRQSGIDTPGYRNSGYGIGGGADVRLGDFGSIGLFVDYTYGDVHDRGGGEVIAHQIQVGPSWIAHWGGLQLAASGGFGFVALGSTRYLADLSTNASELLSSDGSWHGISLSGSVRASYEFSSGLFYARPSGSLTYFRLHEKAHQESGGNAIDLAIGARTGDELAATAMLAIGLHVGSGDDADTPSFRLEAEAGRRQILSGSQGATTASFAGGTGFALLPEDRESGYVGALSASYGSSAVRVIATASDEQRSGYHALVGKITLRGSF